MKTKLEIVLDEYEDLMAGQVNYFLYCLLNLSMKADGTAMLSARITVKGEEKNIEDVATVAKTNDYQYCIVPKGDEFLEPIIKGIALVHPEMKVNIMAMDSNGLTPLAVNDEVPEGKTRVITLDVPEVNKDRYDTINQAIDTFYDKCKVDMEGYKQKYAVKLATTIEGMDKDTAEGAKETFDDITKDYAEKRDNLRDKKKAEADDAYQHYTTQHEEQKAKKQEEELATNKKAGMSMNILNNED